MISKFLTENARITDAYMRVQKAEVSESAKSKGNGNLLKSLKGQLPIDGKGSRRTGSKLGVRKVMPFEKRDSKPCCSSKVPLKKTYGNGLVKSDKLVGGTKTVKHEIPSKTGSKLGVRKVLPFEKRDEKPTSVGRIKNVKDVSKVSRVSLKKLGESFEEIDVTSDGGDDVEDDEVTSCEDCSRKDELLDTVLLAFDQIYDNLSDDDKETVDEVREEIELVLNGDEDDDIDDEDEDEDEDDINESIINEAGVNPIKAMEKVLQKSKNTFAELKKMASVYGKEFRSAEEIEKYIADAKASGKTVPNEGELLKHAKILKDYQSTYEDLLADVLRGNSLNRNAFQRGLSKLNALNPTQWTNTGALRLQEYAKTANELVRSGKEMNAETMKKLMELRAKLIRQHKFDTEAVDAYLASHGVVYENGRFLRATEPEVAEAEKLWKNLKEKNLKGLDKNTAGQDWASAAKLLAEGGAAAAAAYYLTKDEDKPETPTPTGTVTTDNRETTTDGKIVNGEDGKEGGKEEGDAATTTDMGNLGGGTQKGSNLSGAGEIQRDITDNMLRMAAVLTTLYETGTTGDPDMDEKFAAFLRKHPSAGRAVNIGYNNVVNGGSNTNVLGEVIKAVANFPGELIGGTADGIKSIFGFNTREMNRMEHLTKALHNMAVEQPTGGATAQQSKDDGKKAKTDAATVTTGTAADVSNGNATDATATPAATTATPTSTPTVKTGTEVAATPTDTAAPADGEQSAEDNKEKDSEADTNKVDDANANAASTEAPSTATDSNANSRSPSMIDRVKERAAERKAARNQNKTEDKTGTPSTGDEQEAQDDAVTTVLPSDAAANPTEQQSSEDAIAASNERERKMRQEMEKQDELLKQRQQRLEELRRQSGS